MASVESTVDRVMPNPGMPLVVGTITTGLQRGTSIERTASTLTLGASLQNDIVLLDDGIADRHAVISFERSLIGTVASIKACDAEVICNGHVISAGCVREASRLPMTLTVGTTAITFGLPQVEEMPAVPEQTSWFGSLVRPVLIVCTLAIGLQAGLFLMHGVAGSSSLRVAQHETVAPVLKVSAPAKGPELQALVEDDFEVTGLDPHLNVSQLPNGALEITGNLPSELKPQWDGLRQWYDRSGLSTQIISLVREASVIPALPALSAVRLSEPRELILMNGTRLRTGDPVGDGWSVAEIAPESVSLQRDGQTTQVPYE